MAEPRILGVGILGLGGAAVNMLPAFERSPFVRIAAACDIDANVLGRFAQDYPGAVTARSIEALCACREVDLVYIGTPTVLHRVHASMALASGKHVLIEKPMAVTLDEADAMIAAAAKSNALLGVNVKHSFEPRVIALRALARSGELGRLRMVHNWRYVDWLYQPRSRAELSPVPGNGILWRQGPHQFDLIRTIGGGLVRSVRGACQMFDPGRGVDGAYSAFLEFEDGVVATAVCTGYDHFNSRALIPGVEPPPHARARRSLASHADDPEWEEHAAADERYMTRPAPSGPSSAWLLGGPLIASFARADVRLSRAGLAVDGDREQWEIPLRDQGDGRDRRIESFYRAIVEGRALPADGRWGKATQELLAAIDRSSQLRKEIRLEHQTAYVD